MSQRVRNFSSNLNTESANEVYIRSLRKKEKPLVKNTASKCPRDRSATRRPSEKHANNGTVGTSISTKLRSASLALRQHNATKGPKTDVSKETFDPTVRHNKKASWGAVLQEQTERSTFSQFDPLRTLHFLSKELQLKVQNNFPGIYKNCILP